MAVRRGRGRAAPQRLKAWSYSVYNQWKQCPRKVYFAKILRHPDPIGKAGQRGIKIHKQAEDYVKGRLEELPESLKKFPEEFEQARESATTEAEAELAFTREWKKTSWRDWDNCWVRMKVDLLDWDPRERSLRMVDLKTGRARDYTDQLELYFVGGLHLYPRAEAFVAEIWYLDSGEIEDLAFNVSELEETTETWEERARKLMEDTEFPAFPGPLCKWCNFSSRKGGPCEVG